MASENVGNGDSGPVAESNEHDYAHTENSEFAPPEVSTSDTHPEPEQNVPGQPSSPLPIELPESVVGAEVDCHDGNYVETQAGGNPTLDSEHVVAECPDVPRRGPRRPKRPEDSSCSACKKPFQRQGRSFNRRAVFTFTNPETVLWVFPDSVVNEKSFLCETCAQVIRAKGKRRQSGKRCMWIKPPAPNKVKDKMVTGCRMGKKSRAVQLFSRSRYKAALTMLWSAKGARKPMMDFFSKQLNMEIKAMSRQSDSPFHQKVSGRKPLSSFPWQQCLSWAQEKAPLVTTCLRSLFPDINTIFRRNHQLTEEQAITLLQRRIVVALSIPLFSRNIWRNNFLQAALGAELRQQGCSGSAIDTLNTMGLSQNKDTVRLLVNRLRNGKEMDEEQVMMMKQEQMTAQMEEEMTDVETGEEEEEEEDEEEVEEDEEEEEKGEEEEEMVMAIEEEVEQEEVQDGVQEEEEDHIVNEKVEEKKKRKKAKKERKQEKRKERGKRKAKKRGEDEEGLEQKKRKVVVVRLGLLKGHSEVGRSDLSAP
ncbi:uncharacterized protein LOC121637403 [Melanotaenia boesemani]|uniref:uncharacterized protein LOC121637403 n=1 Tax=Melanotaenia boesemani TaxID=1250792 RepID=UPI001C0586E5|nr:uncharacterized protein LOC121637403 [Melanotaenia boesemani]